MSLRDNPNIIEEVSDIRRDLDELSANIQGGISGPITTDMIEDGAVTTDKIGDEAVNQAKVDMADLTTMTSISVTRYFTPASGYTFSGAMWKLGHFVFGTVEMTHSISVNQNNIGTASSHIRYATYGAGRVGDSQALTSYAATVLAIPGGQLRLHAAHAGSSAAFTILMYVDD